MGVDPHDTIGLQRTSLHNTDVDAKQRGLGYIDVKATDCSGFKERSESIDASRLQGFFFRSVATQRWARANAAPTLFGAESSVANID